MTTTYNISHNDWVQCDSQGYVQARGIQVRDCGDGTVMVGTSVYPEHELTILPDGEGCRIEHVGGAWYLVR